MNITRKKLLELCGAVCAAALFAASIAHVAAHALGVEISALRLYVAAFCVSLPVGACYYSKWVGVAGVCAGGLGLVALCLNDAKTALGALWGQAPALSDYAPFALLAGSAFLTLLAFGLCRTRGGVYPALAIAVVVLIAGWELDLEFNVWRAFPALVALAAMFAESASGRAGLARALVSVALIAALAATALLPGEPPVYPPLQNAAQTVRAMFEDYFRFTHSRVAYSLYMDGYQPLGEGLGGPAQPSEEPVMRVETPETLYLRGTIRSTYTGWSWTDSAVRSRYLFIDPIRRGVRDSVFDVSLSDSGAFYTATARIEFLAEGTSTLFVPHRLTDIAAPATMATYFNTSGEVFLPRSVQAGDAYSVTAWIPRSEEALAPLSGLTIGQQGDTALTQLPSTVDARVYQLAISLTQGALNDYEKAARIRDYLRETYHYTLNGAYVDRNTDFVSAFLFDLREGYCTYFASAMAVLARAAGLSSRYVEGSYVPAEADGETLVTGMNAHAWAEVWVEGLGWLVFDATPGDGESGNRAPETGDTAPTPTPETGSDAPTPTPDSGGDAAPTPTPETGESAPTPTPDMGGDAAPSPTPENGENPAVPPDGGENDNNPPEPPLDSDSDPNFTWLWWLLAALALLALLAAAAFWRLRQSDPRYAASAMRDRDARLLVWYRALLSVFAAEGQSPDSGESPAMFAHRMRAAGLATETFEQFAQAVMSARYAARPATPEQLSLAAQAYAQLVSQLRPAERARWLRMRLMNGLGDIGRIP